MTMKLISSITIGVGGASSVTFSSIPQDGSSLVLRSFARSTRAEFFDEIIARPNGTTGGNSTIVASTGVAQAATTHSFMAVGYATAGSSEVATWGSSVATIPSYTNSLAKVAAANGAAENNNTTARVGFFGARSTETAPITSLTLLANGGSFVEGSMFSLYMVIADNGGATVTTA